MNVICVEGYLEDVVNVCLGVWICILEDELFLFVLYDINVVFIFRYIDGKNDVYFIVLKIFICWFILFNCNNVLLMMKIKFVICCWILEMMKNKLLKFYLYVCCVICKCIMSL